jgi:hypothetical protein
LEAIFAEGQLLDVEVGRFDSVEQPQGVKLVDLDCSRAGATCKQASIRAGRERMAICAEALQLLITKRIKDYEFAIEVRNGDETYGWVGLKTRAVTRCILVSPLGSFFPQLP